MPTKEWFRHEEWSPEIEKEFFDRLRRAKKKDQYLRIQAGYLASTHPQVALDLIRRFFELRDPWDRASAYRVQGKAHESLNAFQAALRSYEDALEQERMMPQILTNAWLDLAMLVSMHAMSDHYDSVLAILRERKKQAVFPSTKFMHDASIALILAARGESATARSFAVAAVDMASRTHSGISRHPHVGLINWDEWQTVIEKLSSLTKNRMS
jgi:tetratricopeptide (TPR) repeat protein